MKSTRVILTNLSNQDLHSKNLSNQNFYQGKFTNSNLRNANFNNSVIHEADFTGADMCGADLRSIIIGKNLKYISYAGTFSWENFKEAGEHFKPLINYFRDFYSTHSGMMDVNKLKIACWITGARDLADFERRCTEIPTGYLTKGLFKKTDSRFGMVIKQVKDNFQNLPIDEQHISVGMKYSK